MNIPMDVEHEFKWEVSQPRRPRQCEYLSPHKRSRVDLDCREIMKYIPKTPEPEKTNILHTHTSKPSYSLSMPFFLVYKYLFRITDVFISSLILYLIFQLFFFLQRDILRKISIKKYELDKLIEEALTNYKINKCSKSTRVPALNDICNKWECVINNGSIKYTNVIFEVIGDVCSGFIDEVSWKSIGVVSIFLIIYLKFRK
ncbi:nucleus export protein [Vairimorpha necatrix]|uniref:Nucleus export protein n=1 Tax=Vairimorpha necatrix TaxID=6039 RepID=A0AAX4JCK8_9MICR